MSQTRVLWTINIVGGALVLGSYALSLFRHSGQGGALWGDIPSNVRPTYTGGMLAAAVGYLLVAYHVLWLGRTEFSLPGGFGPSALPWVFVLILLPSALWIDLTFAYINAPSSTLWLTIRAVLAAVALGSLLLVGGLLHARPPEAPMSYWLAVLGATLFAAHTTILDAVLWPIFFEK